MQYSGTAYNTWSLWRLNINRLTAFEDSFSRNAMLVTTLFRLGNMVYMVLLLK